MRILFDSKLATFKAPFGTLLPDESCTLHIHIPASVRADGVVCVLLEQDHRPHLRAPLHRCGEMGCYEDFCGSFSLSAPGLYFYYFEISCPTGPFRLYKQHDGTNMEAGDLWQVSCIPQGFTTPQWAAGGVIYQVFPDRFCREGRCEPTGKLTPYTLHEDWYEELHWQPDSRGQILNNDFYGGNFKGITAKLDYLASLGTTVLYLNPICMAFSSHRYDTAHYKRPDPLLGTEADFAALCRAAHQRGIRVILDGVFSHTGANSLYFNREGSFSEVGAYQSTASPYYSWYQFDAWPKGYKSWWGFDTLPTVNKLDESFMEHIITAPDSVIAHWLALGADGFRLDVADELPDAFLRALKTQLRRLKPDALLMGEVWEDASNKLAYGVRRRYFVDGTLDSVMNYPLQKALLAFGRGTDGGEGLRSTVMTLAENYPPQVLCCCMNHLGTHDTARVLTALMEEPTGDRATLAAHRLTPRQRREAVERLKMISFLQFMLPGSPSIYYGDEAGMEGAKDPFNRRTYPWGREDQSLLAHYRALGGLRRQYGRLCRGGIEFCTARGGRLHFCREDLHIYINRTGEAWPLQGKLLFGRRLEAADPSAVTLAPGGYCLME